MFRAVIFDFDGVITDSELLHLRAFNGVLERFGFRLTAREYYADYLGLTDRDCFEALLRQGRFKAGTERIAELVEQKNRLFEEFARADGRIIPGVRDFLDLLRRNGIPAAICSGAVQAEVELILGEARLRGFFDVLVCAEHVQKGKPDPEGFLLALAGLNTGRKEPILPGQCVAVEDSHWGIEAAVAAGMKTVAVTNSYDAGRLQAADRVVDRLDSLTLEDLRRLCGGRRE
jgi:beta-phosphoglucomutase